MNEGKRKYTLAKLILIEILEKFCQARNPLDILVKILDWKLECTGESYYLSDRQRRDLDVGEFEIDLLKEEWKKEFVERSSMISDLDKAFELWEKGKEKGKI
jgi:hypothetical protein